MLQRPSKELKAVRIKDPLQNLTDSEIATINKTRSIDAKASEKKDSEANLQATVIYTNRKRKEIGSSARSVAKEVGSLFYARDMPMLLFQRVTYLDESPSPYDR